MLISLTTTTTNYIKKLKSRLVFIIIIELMCVCPALPPAGEDAVSHFRWCWFTHWNSAAHV